MICSRTGCEKKLRSNNTKGTCGSGCESPEAPAYQRAKGVGGKPKQARAKAEPVTLDEVTEVTGSAARFRAVHDAMGMDPDKTLEEFYASWLDGIRQALES